MKRNLAKRILTATALAAIAAAVSSCGSSNNNNGVATACYNGVCTTGLAGAAVNANQGGCTVSFAGNISGYDASGAIYGQFQVTGETAGMMTPSGGYTAVRQNNVDGSMIEIAQNGPMLQGILSMAPDNFAPLGTSTCPGQLSEVTLQSILIQGGTIGGTGGNNILLNGSYPINTL